MGNFSKKIIFSKIRIFKIFKINNDYGLSETSGIFIERKS